jgi:hypothetical protein
MRATVIGLITLFIGATAVSALTFLLLVSLVISAALASAAVLFQGPEQALLSRLLALAVSLLALTVVFALLYKSAAPLSMVMAASSVLPIAWYFRSFPCCAWWGTHHPGAASRPLRRTFRRAFTAPSPHAPFGRVWTLAILAPSRSQMDNTTLCSFFTRLSQDSDILCGFVTVSEGYIV